MGTRSRIGIELKDSSILSVYHHWDGYPEWLGKQLNKHFTTREAVTKLIDGGDMSSCRTNCGWQHETRPESGPMYYSERGEDCPPRMDSSLIEYVNNSSVTGFVEYVYVFNTMNEWVCYEMDSSESPIATLTEIPE